MPEHGRCTVLQGELLRAVQSLAEEAQHNGNINWDRDFERFCDLLHTHLHDAALPAEEWAAADRDLDVLRRYGRVAYAMKPDWARDEDYPDPAVPEPLTEDLAQGLPAYVHDDVYDHLSDCVARSPGRTRGRCTTRHRPTNSAERNGRPVSPAVAGR